MLYLTSKHGGKGWHGGKGCSRGEPRRRSVERGSVGVECPPGLPAPHLKESSVSGPAACSEESKKNSWGTGILVDFCDRKGVLYSPEEGLCQSSFSA